MHTESDNSRSKSVPIASSIYTICKWRNNSEQFDQEYQAKGNPDHSSDLLEDDHKANNDNGETSRSRSPTPSRVSHFEATRVRRASSGKHKNGPEVGQQSWTSSGESASSLTTSQNPSAQQDTNESTLLLEARELLKPKYDPAFKLKRITAVDNICSLKKLTKALKAWKINLVHTLLVLC